MPRSVFVRSTTSAATRDALAGGVPAASEPGEEEQRPAMQTIVVTPSRVHWLSMASNLAIVTPVQRCENRFVYARIQSQCRNSGHARRHHSEHPTPRKCRPALRRTARRPLSGRRSRADRERRRTTTRRARCGRGASRRSVGRPDRTASPGCNRAASVLCRCSPRSAARPRAGRGVAQSWR